MSNVPSFYPEDDFSEIVQFDPELSGLMDEEDRRAIRNKDRQVVHEESPDHYGYKGDFWSDR